MNDSGWIDSLMVFLCQVGAVMFWGMVIYAMLQRLVWGHWPACGW